MSLLTAREVAGRLRVNVATVWRWVREGRLAVIRTPTNRMRFTLQALEEAQDRGSDGDTHGGDAATRPPDRQELPAGGPPPTRWGGCGFPLPEDYRTGGDTHCWCGRSGGDTHCWCGAPYRAHG